jgi:D-hexose-6-phosphate mutarotase
MPPPEGLTERDAGGRWTLRPSPLVSFGLQHGSGKSDTLSRFATPFSARACLLEAGYHRSRARRSAVHVYFHLKDAHEVIRDAEGVEVSDVQEARVHAVRAIEELRQQEGQHWSGWTLAATDAAGQILFTIDLDSTA